MLGRGRATWALVGFVALACLDLSESSSPKSPDGGKNALKDGGFPQSDAKSDSDGASGVGGSTSSGGTTTGGAAGVASGGTPAGGGVAGSGGMSSGGTPSGGGSGGTCTKTGCGNKCGNVDDCGELISCYCPLDSTCVTGMCQLAITFKCGGGSCPFGFTQANYPQQSSCGCMLSTYCFDPALVQTVPGFGPCPDGFHGAVDVAYPCGTTGQGEYYCIRDSA